MDNTKTQVIRRENVNYFIEFPNLHNNRVGNQNLFEEHHQDLSLNHPLEGKETCKLQCFKLIRGNPSIKKKEKKKKKYILL